MTPLQNILQFRPSFYYIEPPKPAKEEVEEPAVMDVKEEESESGEAITVQLQGPETTRSLAAKKRAEARKIEEEEQWMDLELIPRDHVSSHYHELFCNHNFPIKAHKLNPTEYLHALSPQPPAKLPVTVSEDDLQANQPKKNLIERVIALLSNGKRKKHGDFFFLLILLCSSYPSILSD